MMSMARDTKSKTIIKLNSLLGDGLVFSSISVQIVADAAGHWEVEYWRGWVYVKIGIWDEERSDVPEWKMIWNVIKNLD